MIKEHLIELATDMGLDFNRDKNFDDAYEDGRVVFDGCNGQRFLFETKTMTDIEIYKQLGQNLITMGKRMKCLEIYNALSITSDNE